MDELEQLLKDFADISAKVGQVARGNALAAQQANDAASKLLVPLQNEALQWQSRAEVSEAMREQAEKDKAELKNRFDERTKQLNDYTAESSKSADQLRANLATAQNEIARLTVLVQSMESHPDVIAAKKKQKADAIAALQAEMAKLDQASQSGTQQ